MDKCEVGSGILSCVVQFNKHKKGYVMDYDCKWVKKEKCKPEEIMSDSVDWIHMHNSGGCVANYKELDYENYLKTCKYFKVRP